MSLDASSIPDWTVARQQDRLLCRLLCWSGHFVYVCSLSLKRGAGLVESRPGSWGNWVVLQFPAAGEDRSLESSCNHTAAPCFSMS